MTGPVRTSLEAHVALDGQVALVTGAAGGIGSAVARVLHEAGAALVLADRVPVEVPYEAMTVTGDLGLEEPNARMFEQIGQRHGRLDILVHAAGVRQDGVVWKMTADAWRSVLRDNLESAFYLVRGAVPLMRERGGSIVLISSINGERGKFGQSNYAASKAGLIGLGRSAARELGRFDIRVNIVAPGMIETPMTTTLPPDVVADSVRESALGRVGRPEDVAGAILFLAGPSSRHVTGQVLRVDGGQLMA